MSSVLLFDVEPSLLDFSVIEIQEFLGKKAKVNVFGLLEVSSENFSWDTTLAILFAETPYRVLLKLAEGDIESPKDFYRLASEVEWTDLWPPKLAFAIRARVKDFELAKQIGKEAGQAVVDSFKRRYGERAKVRLENPDIEVHVWFSEGKAIIALDLTGELNQLEKALARSLILFSGWDKKSPFAEILFSGISISAYKLSARDAMRERIRGRPLIKLLNIDKEAILKALRTSWRREPPKIVCYERRERFSILTEENPDIRKVALKDIRYVGLLEEDVLVSNLHDSLRKKDLQKEFFASYISKVLSNENWHSFVILASSGVLEVPEAVERRMLSLKGTELELVAIRR